MVPLGALWIPALVSSIAVFIASFLFWMVIRHHASDWKGMPSEESVLEAMRKAGLKRGQYRFPYAEARKMQSPEMKKKMAEGPAGHLYYFERWEGSMGKSLASWFVYLLGVSLFVAYLTGRVLASGAPYASVFRIAGTAAILAYAGALIPHSIWWGRSWSTTAKDVFDGVVYGLLTGGVFGWLWPR
jgi:hypothetical protein